MNDLKRRYFSASLRAGILMAGAFLAQPAAGGSLPTIDPAKPTCPTPGTSDTRWIGLSQLHGGKGYADTPMGQVHYRLTGEGDGPVLLLLHQTPWSMIQYAEVQTCLAGLGVRTLAVDTPGYGMSDAPEGRPTIADYADNIIPVLDELGIENVIVAGHHTGAGIAAAFVARHPDRTVGLLLHGTPLYSEEEHAQRLALPERGRELAPDGSHLSSYFNSIRDYVGTEPRTLVTANWSTLFWYLAGAADVAHDAVYRYDLEKDLLAVRSPVLILSDKGDSLHENDMRAAKMRPWFRYRLFSDGRSHSLMIDPARWSVLAARFVQEIRDGTAPEPSE